MMQTGIGKGQMEMTELLDEIGILFDNRVVFYDPNYDFAHRSDLVFHAVTLRPEHQGVQTIEQWAQNTVDMLLAQIPTTVRSWRWTQFVTGGLEIMVWGYIR